MKIPVEVTGRTKDGATWLHTSDRTPVGIAELLERYELLNGEVDIKVIIEISPKKKT